MEIELGKIIFRTVFTYLIIVVIFRLMGKREIGELSLLDIVVFIMVGEMAVFAIEEPKSNIAQAIIPMAILLLIQRFTAWASLKNQRFRGWFEGKPSVIISKGKIDEHEMRKQRYNFNDLMQQLRENGTKSIQDVEFAILEASGKLSIFEKSVNGSDGISSEGYVVPVIVDGKIQYGALEKIDKSEDWLLGEVNKRDLTIEQVSFCSIDKDGRIFVDIKNEKK
ncbi:DUF421 domain-containing protein [Sediminibacillus halophilus]|uniref:Uncharacterized membrane protein YcaP, DUF421 family n=1 Tax=Sediminibacillus halophilus TaxID=482461 RepID=A0A1G9XSD4_9BACI|nr:DUF421 domain-containing protein [Sediminibacillus halophilus]SDM99421.1 Uncharacterized membrane protein YcaP, DUF421 family [Sediminibacillus halophilus]